MKQQEPLINTESCTAGIEYSDAFLHDNDARFVFNFVRNAMEKGCAAANYIASKGARRDDEGNWVVEVNDHESGRTFEIRSKVLVNATGPFVDEHNRLTGISTDYRHVLSKGIHLIGPRISAHHRVLAFFADDERLFFAIPMANRTCIGTTDTLVDDPITSVTEADREFVLSNINARLDLEKPLSHDDIIAERCGVRPLAVKSGKETEVDNKQLSRKHVIETDKAAKHISIFGGKLTDCLNVGDEVCAMVSELGVPLREPAGKWYGEPGKQDRDAFFDRARQLGIDDIIAGDTGEVLSVRLWRRYANHAQEMLDAIEKDSSLTEPLIDNAGIRRCEVSYLAENELIVRLEDYLRRRSKIELLVDNETLKSSDGIFEACKQLFGDQARARYDEYFSGGKSAS